MKIFPALASILLALPVSAQEHPGNWWVNPTTGDVEQIEDGGAVATESEDRGDWIVIAQLTRGRELKVREYGVRSRILTSGEEQRYFTARIVQGRRSLDSSVYYAYCEDRALLSGGVDLPIAPGTVAEVLFNWACGTR